MKLRTFSHLLIPCMLLFAWNQTPGQVLTMSTEQLVKESSAIVVGTCREKKSFWNEKRDKIFTEVTLRVDQSLKGDVGPETVVTIPGGRVGSTIYEVTDMPAFLDGEEMVLFLWQHPSGKNLVTGAMQGKLTIQVDRKTGKKVVRGVPIGIDDAAKLQKAAPEKQKVMKEIMLDDFIKEVQGYVKK